MDIFTKEKRSEIMSKVRSKGNLSTEASMISLFHEYGVTGWRRNIKMPGNPDFVFKKEKVAIFVDGCFWHGCPYCGTIPKTNTEFWKNKISRNKKRDRQVSNQLRNLGWTVLRIKECRLKKYPKAQIALIVRKVH